MKLTFLGTSHGVPAADRYCSSAMLQVADRTYLIDAGAPVADLLQRYGVPFSAVKAVFTTHIHGDHTFGLPALCDLAGWYFKDADFDVFLTEQVGIDALHAFVMATSKNFDDDRVRLRLVQPGTFYDDGTLRVTAVPTRHMDYGTQQYPSYAYVLEAEGKRLIFTGDLHGPDAADFPAPALELPSEAVVCEMAHFGGEAVFPYLKCCPTGRVLFHHVFHDYEQSMADIAAAGRPEDGWCCPVDAVADGDVFEF